MIIRTRQTGYFPFYFSILFIFFQWQGAAAQQVTGKLGSNMLNEVSGVAVSARHSNRLYVHNDSGDGNRLFAIATDGRLLGVLNFEQDEPVKDCEDIELGPGPKKGQSYIYLADIGDNLGMRETIAIYRIEEPRVLSASMQVVADKITLRYPDGPRDAESILIDPLEKMLYIISKREDSPHIYRCPLDMQAGDTIELGFCGRLLLKDVSARNWIVAGSISASGNKILLKTINNVYYWPRLGREPVYRSLQRSPVRQARYKSRGQEEAVAFTGKANGYYVLSEGRGTAVYLYRLQEQDTNNK